MMYEGQQSDSISKQPAEQNLDCCLTSKETAVRLSDALRELMEGWILPQQARFETVLETWAGLLPAELRQHCRIVDLRGGQLKVLVDRPAYMYELQLCSSQLLKELQQACPRARIKKIKFVVG